MNNPDKPSLHFCKTGYLDKDEQYNQNIHNIGVSPTQRCSLFYDEETIAKLSEDNDEKNDDEPKGGKLTLKKRRKIIRRRGCRTTKKINKKKNIKTKKVKKIKT